ncbi:MAG: type II toxin-antitoxin system RelE/ParE family toxin [Bacteroidia bacterium]|nr:type II toxin-antitoxin system RelE/ParE family toxin [Bacteroidia bacterium]
MNYKVKTIPYFDRQAKRLTCKFASFKKELAELFCSLETDPTQGTALGNDCYKIRVAIKSKGKGKSGGARAVTHVIAVKEDVYMLTVFDKSEKGNISDKELQKFLKMII